MKECRLWRAWDIYTRQLVENGKGSILSLNLTGELRYSAIFLTTSEHPKSLFCSLYLTVLFTATFLFFLSGINKIEQTKGAFKKLLFVCAEWSGQIFAMCKNFKMFIYHHFYCNLLYFSHKVSCRMTVLCFLCLLHERKAYGHLLKYMDFTSYTYAFLAVLKRGFVFLYILLVSSPILLWR